MLKSRDGRRGAFVLELNPSDATPRECGLHREIADSERTQPEQIETIDNVVRVGIYLLCDNAQIEVINNFCMKKRALADGIALMSRIENVPEREAAVDIFVERYQFVMDASRGQNIDLVAA